MQQRLKCPEPDCKEMVDVWTGPYLITQDQRNLDRACDRHKEKYRKIVEDSERFVAMVNRFRD